MTPTLKLVDQFDDRLKKAEIRNCLWKSNNNLEGIMIGDRDFDLLVDQSQSAQFEKILTELGFQRFISQAWARYDGIEDWLGFDHETGKMVHIHLHYNLVMGRKYVKEHHLPWESLVLNAAKRDGVFKFNIVDPNLEIVILVIRIGLKTRIRKTLSGSSNKASVEKKLLEEYHFLREQTDTEMFKRNAVRLLGKIHGQELVSIILEEDLEEVETIKRIKTITDKSLGSHRRYRTTKIWMIYIYRRFMYLFSRLQRKLQVSYTQIGKRMYPKGAIIAIIGCDGSGKSTISSEIQKWLAWKIDARKIYLGSGDGSVGILVRFLKSLARRSRGKTVHKTSKTSSSSKNGSSSRSFVKEIGSCLLDMSITNERYRKVKKAHQARMKGSVLVTDRYPQNQFEGIYDGPRIPRRDMHSNVRKFFAKLEREKYEKLTQLSPDVVIKLHVPLEVALERKPGHDAENIRQKAEITSALKFNGARVVDIDATRSLEEVLISVKQVIWETFSHDASYN